MNLLQALRLSTPAGIPGGIAFVGAGGKTTAMFQLARALPSPVVVTATTHLGTWQLHLADEHIIADTPAPIEALEHSLSGVVLITGPIAENKTGPIPEALAYWLREFCDYHHVPLLIEADGARQKLLKAPAEHEPAIPAFVQHVVYVAGLSALDKPLTDEYVHRPEIFSRTSGLALGERITTDALVAALSHPQGGLKNIPPASKRTLVLNQADTTELQSRAGSVSPALLKAFDSVIVASLNEEPRIHAVYEKTAGIILAAGASTRFGQPKQLLDWRGQPFVRIVAETALSAGLSPVLVITGANAEVVENTVKDLDVSIIRNKDWERGQSSSIKAGVLPLLQAVREITGGGVGAAIFLLADQPQIGTDIIRALMEVHARELYPIVVPLVLEERRANPVLFDQVTFSGLLTLEGDVGGRAIFSKHRVKYIPWHDGRLLLDVDKPEDYQRLMDMDSNAS